MISSDELGKLLATLPIHLISFGFKRGLPPGKVDLYIDCRSIPNPFHALRGVGGATTEKKAWVLEYGAEIVEAFETQIKVALRQIPSRRREMAVEEMFTRPFVIACGCAYGQHRSVAVKHILAERLAGKGYCVEVGDEG